MKILLKKKQIFIFIATIFAIGLLLYKIFFVSSKPKLENFLIKYNIQPKCQCRNKLNKLMPGIDMNRLLNDPKYQRSQGVYKFTCDMHNLLNRGVNQRVFGFSIYGTNDNSYKHLRHNIAAMKKLHPDWIARVYYDSTLNKSVVCEFECNENKVDFCNVAELPYYNYASDKVEYYDASYVHAMMWRWFPFGDDFVDYFSSRDIESLLVKREKDSMNVWLTKEKTLFHIMRDSPFHMIPMLGGMFGYANIRNRNYGKHVFEKILRNSSQSVYNSLKNDKDKDQAFLMMEIWPFAKLNATQHDSYYCKRFGGAPFPTQRPNDSYCFVACFDPCCDPSLKTEKRIRECPIGCRKDPSWLFC